MALLVLAVVPVAGCSASQPSSTSSPARLAADTRPAACGQFDAIAATIESQGPQANVKPELESIASSAQAAGDTEVAAAARAMLTAKAAGDPGQWYGGLGQMEAACQGQR